MALTDQAHTLTPVMLFVMLSCYVTLQVFDHHYHFDHLLDTAYEVEEGHGLPGGSPEDASPISSQGDLSELGEHCCFHFLFYVVVWLLCLLHHAWRGMPAPSAARVTAWIWASALCYCLELEFHSADPAVNARWQAWLVPLQACAACLHVLVHASAAQFSCM
jgi:hypothetical protein